jgi:hypothetical protein
METGLQIAAVVMIVTGFIVIVVYQRWKRTSETQIDIDTRLHNDDEQSKEG